MINDNIGYWIEEKRDFNEKFALNRKKLVQMNEILSVYENQVAEIGIVFNQFMSAIEIFIGKTV